jgi:hypothetical protein
VALQLLFQRQDWEMAQLVGWEVDLVSNRHFGPGRKISRSLSVRE